MSSHLPVMMYGALPYSDRDDFQRHIDDLRRSLPESPSFTFTPTGFATKADLDEAVNRIESQMVALFEWLKERETKPKKKRKARR